MTKIHGGEAKLAAGILARLADDSAGRRSIRWLADRTGIPYSTLQWKLRNRPGRFTTGELFEIADALGIELPELLKAA